MSYLKVCFAPKHSLHLNYMRESPECPQGPCTGGHGARSPPFTPVPPRCQAPQDNPSSRILSSLCSLAGVDPLLLHQELGAKVAAPSARLTQPREAKPPPVLRTRPRAPTPVHEQSVTTRHRESWVTVSRLWFRNKTSTTNSRTPDEVRSFISFSFC